MSALMKYGIPAFRTRQRESLNARLPWPQTGELTLGPRPPQQH